MFYGEQPVDADGARSVLALDATLRDARPDLHAGTGDRPGAAVPPVSPVRTVTRLRGHRRTVVVVALVVALLVVLSVLTVGSARHGGDLDPDNPGASGAQAVARVLARPRRRR